MSVIKLLSFLGVLFVCNSAMAEGYMGLQFGYSTPSELSSVSGDENTNYPNSSTDSTLLKETNISNLKLKSSPLIGFKFGGYLEEKPFLGFEFEFFHTKPNFEAQDVRLSHSGIPAIFSPYSNTYFTEKQRSADVKLFTLAFNVMLRYKNQTKFIPYFGVGPAMYDWGVTGTGTSCEIIETGNPPCSAGDVDGKGLTFGTNLKFGLEYNITENTAIGLEYKYNWTRFKLDQFRSVQNARGTYQAQAIIISITKKSSF